jgi:hypothetical protein
MNFGWHNTVGAPFLESGCLISNNAREFAVPPLGTEFDETGRFEPGSTFDSLKAVPLRDGGTADATVVPGPIGYTDFVAGAVPGDCPGLVRRDQSEAEDGLSLLVQRTGKPTEG